MTSLRCGKCQSSIYLNMGMQIFPAGHCVAKTFYQSVVFSVVWTYFQLDDISEIIFSSLEVKFELDAQKTCHRTAGPAFLLGGCYLIQQWCCQSMLTVAGWSV